MLNIYNVFSLAVATEGHKNALLVSPIIVLLITAITAEARSSWKGETVFIV